MASVAAPDEPGARWPTRTPLSWGYGAELAARIADECFPFLDAPVRRVASADSFVGYAPDLEDVILPQVERLAQALKELCAF